MNLKTYNISGKLYSFDVTCTDGGIPYGYCKKLKKWGWLFKGYIQLDDGQILIAKEVQ